MGFSIVAVSELLAGAANHYSSALRASPKAVDYLRGRGVGGAIASRFGLGYARPGWDGLSELLKDFEMETITASGLRVESTTGGHFDYFRDRIMFPVRDISGKTVGFGGRVLGSTDAGAKYINSPEGVLFQKRNLLYGLYEAQASIQAEGVAVVVEGYLDVVSLSQAGFPAAVGTMGTACTAAQIETLLKFTSKIVFCFDGDGAGYRAALRALETALPYAEDHREFSFVFLPSEHDPDSFVREYGVDAFRALIANLSHAKDSAGDAWASTLSGFICNTLLDSHDCTSIEGKSALLSEAKPYCLAMPQGKYRDELIQQCLSIGGVTRQELLTIWGLSC